MKENDDKDFVFGFLVGIGSLFLIIFIISCFFQLLWNAAFVGSIEGVNPITFWQAYGLLIMIHIIGKIMIGKITIIDSDKK